MKLFGKNKVGRNSIKESLDNLPSGVCFAKVNGVIVLQNHKMDALARELIGRDLQHLSELETALNKPNETVKLINPQHSLYLFPDNTVWQFSESNITDNSGCTYILIASYDVTELYRKEKELEKENEELMEVNGRAKALYSQIEQIVKDEETLALKAKIHDDLGMELLNSRKLLSKEPTLEEMKQQGLRWEHIAKTLGSSEEESFNKPPFSSYEELKELTNFAFNLGLSLNIYGEMPKDEQSAKLILAAIRECITNTVKHARATVIYVKLTDSNGKIKAEITNDGIAPEKEIVEGGGLSSLRKRIEQAGGTMEIESLPKFKLTVISVPCGQD